MRTHSQPSGQLFPKRWPLSSPNLTKSIMNKHQVKHHRNSDTKTGNREPHQNHRIGTVSNELLGGHKHVLLAKNSPSITNKHLVGCSVCMIILLLINEASRLTNKSRLHTMKKERRGLNRYNMLQDGWTS